MIAFTAVCLECGKRFRAASFLPTCPRCKGSDIEVAHEARDCSTAVARATWRATPGTEVSA